MNKNKTCSELFTYANWNLSVTVRQAKIFLKSIAGPGLLMAGTETKELFLFFYAGVRFSLCSFSCYKN